MDDERYSGVTREDVARLVGDCHLVDDPGSAFAPGHGSGGEPLFVDDDLGIRPQSCACLRLYLRVSRRVPREVWQYVVPVTVVQTDEIRRAVAAARAEGRDGYAAAQSAVLQVFAQHPYLEQVAGSRGPAVLRWRGPSTPMAFGFSPV